MNFNSLEFLILFLPVTLVAFYAAPMRLRLWVLVVASLVFYGVSGVDVLARLRDRDPLGLRHGLPVRQDGRGRLAIVYRDLGARSYS